MKYREIEYSVVQGIGGHLWKWSASVAGAVGTGQAHTRPAAIAAAEKAIDKALAVKKGATCSALALRLELSIRS
jgi:hypothetical protein